MIFKTSQRKERGFEMTGFLIVITEMFLFQCGLCGVCKFETEEEERGHRKFCKHSQATGPLPKAQPGYSTCTICFEVVDNASLVVRSHFLVCLDSLD